MPHANTKWNDETPTDGLQRLKNGATTPSIASQFSLDGKVGIVAGGAGALGLESALAVLEAGANIYVVDIVAPESLKDDFKLVQSFAKQNGRKLEYRRGNICSEAYVKSLVQEVAEKEQRLDFCVLANGWLHPEAPILDLPEETWEKTMKINTTGCFLLAQAVAKQMKDFGTPGSIVIYASISGIRIQRQAPNQHHSWAAYAASKAAAHQLTRNFACELAKDRIRCNSISPGQFWTPMTNTMLTTNPGLYNHWSQNNNPMGRLGRTDEIRGAVVYLCSQASSYVTGIDHIVDGGMVLW
ncbi:hypothetical protein JCM8547_008322 [Rhodosporidiobolus lusitaniae]